MQKIVTIRFSEYGESDKKISSGILPVSVHGHETFEDLLKRISHSAQVPDEIKSSIKNYLSGGNTGLVFYVIDQFGEKRAIGLKDSVSKVTDTYGTNQIYMDIQHFVGGL